MATHSSILVWKNLENPMERGASWATVHGVTESDTTERARAHTHTHTHTQLCGRCWLQETHLGAIKRVPQGPYLELGATVTPLLINKEAGVLCGKAILTPGDAPSISQKHHFLPVPLPWQPGRPQGLPISAGAQMVQEA